MIVLHKLFLVRNCGRTDRKGDQEAMGLVSSEFFESNENSPKDEWKELPGINERTLRYYKEIGFLKGIRTRKKKGRYIFSPKDISFLSFIRDLRYVGLPLSEVKKIGGIRKISETNDRGVRLLRLQTLLEELFERIESKKRKLERLKRDILNCKKGLEIFKES